MKNKKLFITAILLVVILGIGGYFKSSQIKSGQFLIINDNVTHEYIDKNDSPCCLAEIICTYCNKKEAGCHCFDRVINNYSPCDECIDKILVGQGNKLLSQNFAPAIAEKMGPEHLATLQTIINTKYPQLNELGVCTKPIAEKEVECEN